MIDIEQNGGRCLQREAVIIPCIMANTIDGRMGDQGGIGHLGTELLGKQAIERLSTIE